MLEIQGDKYFPVFEIANGIFVYAQNSTTKGTFDEVNGILLESNDIFIKLPEKRAATKEELHSAIDSVQRAQIPCADISAAIVRTLSGIKPKRLAKSKVPAKPVRDASVSSESEEDLDEDEEEDDEEDDEEEEEDEDD